MSLKDQLMEDLKTSMKNKDVIRKNTITMVRAAIKQEEVDKRVELSDEQIQEIISKQVKEKNKAIPDFEKGGRDDLVEETKKEIEILLDYLPKQLTEEELTDIVREVIESGNFTSKKDMGKIMGQVMPKIKGRADGNRVNAIVNKILS